MVFQSMCLHGEFFTKIFSLKPWDFYVSKYFSTKTHEIPFGNILLRNSKLKNLDLHFKWFSPKKLMWYPLCDPQAIIRIWLCYGEWCGPRKSALTRLRNLAWSELELESNHSAKLASWCSTIKKKKKKKVEVNLMQIFSFLNNLTQFYSIELNYPSLKRNKKKL